MQITRIALALLMMCSVVSAQYITYYIQGLHRQGTAQFAREYLGIYGTSGTNYVPGVGVTFTATGPYTYSIAAGAGGAIQLTGDVLGGPGASPLATTLAVLHGGGVNTKITYNTKGLVTGSAAAVLASADYLNQGTTTTLLHGNAAGNPSWGAVDLANDVTGDLAVTHLNGGTGAGVGTFWQGNGTWGIPAGTGGQTNISYTGVTNAPWQWGCANLTNWCDLTTNTVLEWVTNYVYNSTNGFTTGSQTNISYTEVTNAPWQWGCANLTNWCELSTNAIGTYVNWGTNLLWEWTTNLVMASSIENVWFSTDGKTNYAGYAAQAGSAGSASGNTAVGYTADAEGPSSGYGSAFGWFASGYNSGSAFGANALAFEYGVAVGRQANGANHGVAVGYLADAANSSTAVGETAQSSGGGVAVGYHANGITDGTAVGYGAIANGYGVAIGDLSDGHGDGNVAIGGTSDVGNTTTVPNGWTDTVELGRGTATARGGLNFRGFGLMTSNFVAVATNFMTTAVKWIDIPMNYAATALGASSPSLTAVTNDSVIMGLGFDNNDELFAQGQFQHNLAITNAAFPNFYFEPHVHFTTIGTLDSTHSNVTWRIEWQVAPINGGWFSGTNSVTMGITNNHVHYMAELGHITNNALGISSVFRCRLMRPASVAQEYDSTPNSHTVIMDAFDLHIPVGNTNAIGSSSDASP